MNKIKTNFAEFCERSGLSTEDVDMALKLAGDGTWLAGGAIRRALISAPQDSDFDYFFKDADALSRFEARLPFGWVLFKETEHHKHYKVELPGSKITRDVQAIRFKFYETAWDVIDSFDYTITQFVIEEGELITTDLALWDLGRRKLAIHKVTYPVATMRRMLKYCKQGFTACGGCMSTLLTETAKNPAALAAMGVTYVD